MFLQYMKDQSRICDFQLIYDTDSKLHFDFYAYGLLKELKILNIEANYSVPAYGMIQISMEGYQQVLDKINQICLDYTLLMDRVKDMNTSICRLMNTDALIERFIEAGICDVDDLKDCFEDMTNVMAYRRLADEACELLSEHIAMERLAEIKIPSYLLILQENKERIKDEDDISVFIKEYGFLSSFDIAPSSYENSDYLRTLSKGEGGLLPMHIGYDDSWCKDDTERIMYGLSWYNELRHIYQLRTLRDFRWYFEKNGIDMHGTDAKELFGI